MLPFSATELSQMRTTQTGAMQDMCRVLVYTGVADAYGNPQPVFIAGEPVECGFEPVRPRETQQSGDVPRIDAHIRLPIATVLEERDRIRVSSRYNEELETVQDYEIVGPVKRGPSGLVVEVVNAVHRSSEEA